jgi:hypothetical protein
MFTLLYFGLRVENGKGAFISLLPQKRRLTGDK